MKALPSDDYRTRHVLSGVTRRWKTLHEIVRIHTALDAKQYSGALVRLRNAGRIESRRVHTNALCHLEWRQRS